MFLSKPVDEELGNQLVATMLYLDSENKKDINLYINCSGGDVRSCNSTNHILHIDGLSNPDGSVAPISMLNAKFPKLTKYAQQKYFS